MYSRALGKCHAMFFPERSGFVAQRSVMEVEVGGFDSKVACGGNCFVGIVAKKTSHCFPFDVHHLFCGVSGEATR